MAKRPRNIAFSQGARLNYRDVDMAGPARDPLPEDQPVFFQGKSNAPAMVLPPGGGEPPEREKLFLFRAEKPKQGYMLVGKATKELGGSSRPNGWGEVHEALVVPRDPAQDSEGLPGFRMPDRNEMKFVAIKRLSKRVVNWYLARGGRENPYIEVARMQQIGDGVHVLECVEALEDEDYLYIVTPFSREGSLLEMVRMEWSTGMPEAKAQEIYKNLLQILLYLERHGIFHHDLSPDNLLFFKGRLLLFDFAMSMRIPREEDGTRYLIKFQGWYGTPPCLPPELYSKEKVPVDGVTCDLWAAAVILYFLLTGQTLYECPLRSDILFRYYILAEGLKPGFNERVVEVLEEAFKPGSDEKQKDDLMTHAMANLNIPPEAREVLINSLRENPSSRWTLIETVESKWVQSNLG